VAADGKQFAIVATAGAGNDATSAVLPPLPKSQAGLKPITPVGPAASGEPLPPLTASPTGLFTAFQPDLVPSGSAYSVTLRPWGMGPDDPAGRTAVVTLYSIVPTAGAPDKFGGLKRHPLLVIMDAQAGGTMELGGPYAAVVTFVASNGKLVPMLSQAIRTAQ
jgi:hypothetical protein